MKKIINKVEDSVKEMCRGIVLANDELELIEKYKVIKKKHCNPNKVALISGGGSGHEPAHAGYIGDGLLDAAVCGDVFASPSQIQVYQAIRSCANDKGVLLIIKNYSGDMMNFQNAAHLAFEDGIKVDYVKVEDDIAVQDSLYTVGRRGVAGTVFVHKIAGAAAKRGLELNQVKNVAQKAADNVRSIGFAFTSCTVPAKGTPTFELAEDEMEYGVGIHGEPGIQREKISGCDSLANRMTDALLNELKVEKNNSVALLINGFGGMPLQELYILNNAVCRILSEKGVRVAKVLVGNYMTSIDMCGASISILKTDAELESLLSDECNSLALKMSGISNVEYSFTDKLERDVCDFALTTDPKFAKICNSVLSYDNIVWIVDKMSECIIKNEVPFCELDSYAGDGDFGMSVAKGFRQLKREWEEVSSHNTIEGFLNACSLIIMENCGGASGPIWGSAFRSAAKAATKKKTLTADDFADIMQAAVNGVQSTGKRSFGRGAEVGDKTLIDALIPCAQKWKELAGSGLTIKQIMLKGAEAAVEGAKATEKIVARMGRAGTVGERSLGHPDAGAYALGVIFTEIAESLN